MQIDWLSALVSTPPELSPGYSSGQFLRIDPEGEVVSRKPSPLDVQDADASSSRSFRVWTPQPHTLHLSGNPVKLLQGHNLFGSCDVPGLYLEAGQWIRQQVGMFPCAARWDSLQFALPRFTRCDITRSYRFDSVSVAQSFIRHVAGAARSRHGAAKLYGSETAIFGEGSRRWSFKVYDKYSEMVHQRKKWNRIFSAFSPTAEPFDDELMQWSYGVVRFELTLRSPELEQLQARLVGRPGVIDRSEHSWQKFALDVWSEYYARVTFNDNAGMTMKKDLLEGTLSTQQRATLQLWRTGTDLRAMYPKATFYRHRGDLLKAVGVDIATPPPTEAAPEAAVALDPAGWDPAPIEARRVEPRASLKTAYKLL